jgi:hypothetical protein
MAKDISQIPAEFIPVSFIGGDEFGMLDEVNAPLISLLLANAAMQDEVDNVKFRVKEGQERSLSDTLGAAVLIGDGTITVTTPANFRTGDVIRIEDELLKCTSGGSNPISVERAAAGAAAAYAGTETIAIFGPIEPDGWTPGDNFDVLPTSYEQFIGNFSEPFETNTNLLNTRLLTFENFTDQYSREKFRQFLKQVEYAFWRSLKSEKLESGRTRRLPDGIEARISSATSVGAALSEGVIDTWAQGLFANGSNTAWAWCDTLAFSQFQSIYGTKMERVPEDEVAKVRVSVVQHSEGDIILARHKEFNNMGLSGVVHGIHMDRLKLVFQQGMGMGVIPVTNVSPHIRKWEWTGSMAPTLARDEEHRSLVDITP